MIDEFGFSIGEEKTASDETKKFTKIILTWLHNKQQMHPEDVLNYMIQENIISNEEIWHLYKDYPGEISLPKIRHYFN